MTTPIAQHFINIRESKPYESQKKLIHVAARTSQVFFGLGCAISMFGIYLHLAPLLTGGSFLYNATVIAFRAIETIICYDAAAVSSNISSIFQSPCLTEFLSKKITHEPTKSLILPYVTMAENFFVLPPEILRKLVKSKEIAKALTHNTIVASNLNPQIEKILDRRFV